MKLTKAIDITIQEMVEIFFSRRLHQQQEFLHAVLLDQRTTINPKKLSKKTGDRFRSRYSTQKREHRDRIEAEKEYPKYLEEARQKLKEKHENSLHKT